MLRIDMAETEAAFTALAAPWRELAARVPACHFTQTYDWYRLCWLHRVAGPGDALRCAGVWAGDRLVGVWPFVQRRKGGVRRLDPISCGLQEEYGDPLLDPAADTPEACGQLLAAVARHADILHVQYLASGSNMLGAVERMRCAKLTVPIDALSIDRRDAPSWSAAMETYPKKLRTNLRSARKRLSEAGEVRFELAEDEAGQGVVIPWVLHQKQAWLARRDKSRDWFHQPQTRQFLEDAARLGDKTGRLGLFSLRLDNVPVAAVIATIDRTRVEMHVTTFDPEYSRFSPGMLIIQDLWQWAYARGLVFDMRTLRTDYKERWASDIVQRHSCFLAPTLKGAARFAPDLLRFKSMLWLEQNVSPERLAPLKTGAKRFLRLLGR